MSGGQLGEIGHDVAREQGMASRQGNPQDVEDALHGDRSVLAEAMALGRREAPVVGVQLARQRAPRQRDQVFEIARTLEDPPGKYSFGEVAVALDEGTNHLGDLVGAVVDLDAPHVLEPLYRRLRRMEPHERGRRRDVHALDVHVAVGAREAVRMRPGDRHDEVPAGGGLPLQHEPRGRRLRRIQPEVFRRHRSGPGRSGDRRLLRLLAR